MAKETCTINMKCPDIDKAARKDMSSSDCPYFSETAPVCDDGECGCLECMERIAKLSKKGE